jgi:esterase/lipase
MDELRYRAVPEKTLFIDLPNTDGLKIKGILRGSLDMSLVVMVHGLPGEGNETLQFLGARYLYEQGFASLRLFLYDSEPHTRNLVDCTLETHVQDFDTVIEYLRAKNVPKIFAEGHSYGGITILRSQVQLDGAVLWDPTHGLVFRDPEVLEYYKNAAIEETETLKLYLDGYGYLEPKTITHEQEAMGDTTHLAAHKGYPLKIISAEKGVMTNFHERYIEAADEPKSHIVIKNAHHQFEDSDEVMLQLFKETADWLKEL